MSHNIPSATKKGKAMENPLAKYQDSQLKGIIESFSVRQGQTKDGAVYYYLAMRLINGYEHRLFLKGAESFPFINAIEMKSTSRQIDVDEF